MLDTNRRNGRALQVGLPWFLVFNPYVSGFGCVGFAQFEWHAECFTMMRCNHSIISREHRELLQQSRGQAGTRSHW
jgi:hypothetical protein